MKSIEKVDFNRLTEDREYRKSPEAGKNRFFIF